MRFLLITKRRYTNRDLLNDRFGRLYHLPARLCELGHRGLVLAADYQNKTPAQDTPMTGLEIQTVPLSLGASWSYLSTLRREARRFKPDVVLASGDIHYGAFGLACARMLGKPFVFDLYDDYATFRAHIPGAAQALRFLVERADHVLSPSEPGAAHIAERNRAVSVIENGVDTTLFHPIPRSEARARLGIPEDEVVFGFFGAIALRRGVETLLEAYAQLRPELGRSRLLLAGVNGIGLDLSAPGIDYRGQRPQADVPALISACDVAVIPYWHDPNTDLSGPCKLAEYMAQEVPIVATRVSNLAALLEDAPQSLCEPDDVADLARAMRAQLRSPQRAPMPAAWTWQRIGDRLAVVLDDVVRTHPRRG